MQGYLNVLHYLRLFFASLLLRVWYKVILQVDLKYRIISGFLSTFQSVVLSKVFSVSSKCRIMLIFFVFLYIGQSGAKPFRNNAFSQAWFVSLKVLYILRLSLSPKCYIISVSPPWGSGANSEPRATWSLVVAFAGLRWFPQYRIICISSHPRDGGWRSHRQC